MLTLISLTGRYAVAQTNVYHPFPDSGAVWMMQFTQWCELAPSFPYPHFNYDYQYSLNGDTIINGTKYTKVFRENLFTNCIFVSPPNNYTCTAPTYYSSYWLAYRNDTITKKVWAINSGPEFLLYDFSLNIGDTMKGTNCEAVIIGIDSILIGTDYRKKFVVDVGLVNGCWIIEGIGNVGNQSGGSMSGPFGEGCCSVCVCNVAWNFNCFIQSGISLYPDTSTCQAINGINALTPLRVPTTIYPNPCKGIFTISYHSSSQQVTLHLTDVTGKIVFTQRLNNMQSAEQINAMGLSDGFYLYELVSDDKVLSTGKIILMK